ncbi:DNA-binding transcriptional response regulator [Mucilaginibacter pedocola]|nr:hypothetical protein [Mucilaginibacter pedocola]
MKTILIYDADEDLADIMCMALELEGYRTYGFNDAKEDCLGLINYTGAQLVLLDFIYAGELTTKWCHAIKCCHPQLPVIALSCNFNIDEVYAQCGFDDRIRKPFDLENLYGTVGKYLR